MPEEQITEKADEDAEQGKSPSTQAGEFVREEIHHVRQGRHGARNPKQAIAIGLSKARRAGIKVPRRPGSAGRTKAVNSGKQTKASGQQQKPSAKRSRAVKAALRREGRQAASSRSLARQARSSAASRGRRKRVAAAKKAARTRAHGADND
jgi:hypothetical protein